MSFTISLLAVLLWPLILQLVFDCLQDYIPQRLQKSEDPQSPPSSYDNIFLNEDEFNKPPPELPPQIPVTITQEEASTSNTDHDQVPSLTHVDLNHLYINKSDGDQFVTLRSTHRFQHKFVTTILYKSLQRERWWCNI